MAEFTQIKNWLDSLGYTKYVSQFESNGFDEWSIVNDITDKDLQAMNIPRGHRKKILKNLASKQNNNAKKSNSSSASLPTLNKSIASSSSDKKLFDSLIARKEIQKQKYKERLMQNEVIRKAPTFLHPKSRHAYYIPKKETKEITAKNKLINEHIIIIDGQADLKYKHWTSTKIHNEAKFRAGIQNKMDKIKQKIQDINLKHHMDCVYKEKYGKQRNDKINKNANNLMKKLHKIETMMLDTQSAINDIENNMVNTLQIKTPSGEPITYKTNAGFWNVSNVITIKDEKIFNYYMQQIQRLTNYKQSNIALINELKNSNMYNDIQKRSNIKQNKNDKKNIKQNLYNKNKKYRQRSKVNEICMTNKKSIIGSIFVPLVFDQQKRKNTKHYYSDILANVISYLDMDESVNLSLTCKLFNTFHLFIQELSYTKIVYDKSGKTKSYVGLGFFIYDKKDKQKLKNGQFGRKINGKYNKYAYMQMKPIRFVELKEKELTEKQKNTADKIKIHKDNMKIYQKQQQEAGYIEIRKNVNKL
eukprot:75470_1